MAGAEERRGEGPSTAVVIAARDDSNLRARIVERRALRGVRAGSALVAIGGRLLAVQDDAWSVAWIDATTGAATLVPLAGDGGPLPKSAKPDFELAFATADGGLCLLGSGSLPTRCAMVRASADLGAIEIRDVPELYATVRRALGLAGRPNLEAAVARRDRLSVFHRGAGVAPSGRVDLQVSSADYAVRRVLAVARFDLGDLDGVPLHFTDATPVGETAVAFLAVAERTSDAVADGPVTGSVIGLLDDSSGATTVRWTRVLGEDGAPTRNKLEGLVIDTDRRGAWALTDADAEEQAADLCRLALEGFARGI